MGAKLVSILFLICTGTLLYGYYQKKQHRHTETDRLSKPFGNLAQLLPPGATIYVHCEPSCLETYMHIRYMLAPRTLVYAPDTIADTTLFIWPKDAPAAAENPIWLHTDSLYSYELNINPH